MYIFTAKYLAFCTRSLKLPLTCSLIFLFSLTGYGWGFRAHKMINRQAVYSLPAPLLLFYKTNIAYITEQAVAADRRRYIIAEEAPKHYIDLDHYGCIDSIPGNRTLAEEKYGIDSMNVHGILPWHIETVLYRLTEAFKQHDMAGILRCSADLGHYLADAHVPLHTTSNYDGQFTGQHGIHAFWESRLPELFSSGYSFWVGPAMYIDNPRKEIRKILRESFNSVDSVLSIEKKLSISFPADRKYAPEQKNGQTVRVFSEEYSEQYHRALNKMVERRMCSAIWYLSSFWFTAWVDAGQPDLVFDNASPAEQENTSQPLTPIREHEH